MKRTGTAQRTTQETSLQASWTLEGGDILLQVGLPFFEHLLHAMAKHGRMGLQLSGKGDIEVDSHHTIEDVGIVLGQALDKALGERRGIERMGHSYAPMDEALARVCVDLGGRAFVQWSGEVEGTYRPTIELSVLKGFLWALAGAAKANIHVDVIRGQDYHHVVEAVFKALGRALREATQPDGTQNLPSTKGVLG
ncbi:MAG: imidazoleglycerol-phosphate dehydratase [Proteobacteria bacterium]|nr:imidazoleglycerol-phosphate dehydratase [Cystobacterineae bacterium]MCL2258688.1 imidazoleglycerol-phosphate dehydratase [Cystobacterineae bacterium]MCL2313985.1 imidazoleglycerol-phosphate dehydratase [Pseudomonadota bacterium]